MGMMLLRARHLTIHAPELDLSVICARHNEGQGGVEGCPIHAPVMPFQHILHNRVAAPKEVSVHLQAFQQQLSSSSAA